jgi:hypothetical protein
MRDLISYLLSVALLILVVIGSTGYIYIALRSKTQSLKKGVDKRNFLKYILFAWLCALFACLFSSVLIVLWTQFPTDMVVLQGLVKLSLVISLLSVIPIIIRISSANFLHHKTKKYFVNKD